MRLTTLTVLASLTALTASFATACVGATGDSRKPRTGDGTGSGTGSDDSKPCTKISMDVTVRSPADMSMLPKSDCYDIYGKLVLQGQSITSLAGLNNINSVTELDLDHTGVTSIDTNHSLGIYGKLTVTGNSKLTNLKQLEFMTASTGILIDGNTALTSLDALALDDPKLEEVDGDVAITGNTVLTVIPLANLVKVTGTLTVSNNPAVTTLGLGKLATTGPIEISDNAKLATLAGFAATSIAGDLAIRNNAALTSLGTMNSLYRVTGNVTIDANPVLANLAAFTTSLRFIDLALTITNNQALTDLGALKHVSLIGAINITGNVNLISCRATEVDKCTTHPVASTIANNKSVTCSQSCT
jgi:hypothetical protein